MYSRLSPPKYHNVPHEKIESNNDRITPNASIDNNNYTYDLESDINNNPSSFLSHINNINVHNR